MNKTGRIRALVAALAMAGSLVGGTMMQSLPAAAKYGPGTETVEYLNRGISAINTGRGMLVSWRYNANDADDAVFKLYRNDELIYTSEAGKATCFLDEGGNSMSQYRVDTLSGEQIISSEKCTLISGQSYIDIPMDIPRGGSDYTYSPNDCSVGDVDGDGEYEIFVKLDPSNAKDNSQSGVTGNVYIDCYKLNGQKLWRIDLGRNIRAGAHYTQFLVADFDLDGKAEMTCKTADGTVDGKGKVIGDGSKDYRNSGGYILSGPEYYTLFDGATGAALDTIPYEFPRETVSKKTWGDDYGNRCDRFLGSVVYLDGVHPSAVSIRGYYTRMTAVAYDVVNKKLTKRWTYDSGWAAAANTGYGNGNHNSMPGDMDGDGKQELLVGAVAFDDNGKILWCNNKGHGDAMHLSDFLPDRPGLEAWVCHEHAPYGVSLLDAKTGQAIFHYDHSKDTGRCAAGNIYAGHPGAEFWGAQSNDVYDEAGKSLGIAKPAQNFLCYWEGDLERELLDGNAVSKINKDKKIDVLLTADGCSSCNGTKATPNLSADIFGDWREEVILHTNDNKFLRIFCTPYTTDYRITTLMHDTQYRAQVASEQNCYNQPPHTSFYLGSDKPLPDRPDVKVLGAENTPSQPVTEPRPAYHCGEEDAFLLGDLNHDGEIDSYDLALLKREVVTPLLNRQDRRRADTNADGSVSLEDLIDMTKYMLGQGALEANANKTSFQYAIDMFWQAGVTEDLNAGFKEKAYVNLDNRVGSYIEWDVYVPEDGDYVCTFGTANGSANTRPMDIETDGGEKTSFEFPSTGAWTTWEEQSLTLKLKAGKNRIRLTSSAAEGGPNFDYLRTAKAQ